MSSDRNEVLGKIGQHEKLVIDMPVMEPNVVVYEEDEENENPSGLQTPNLSETMETLKRTLSFSGIQEMSGQSRAEVRRKIQNKVWRPKDEEARIPNDWERLLVHVVRAGARAFMLSYGLRSMMTFLLTLVKALRSRGKIEKVALKNAFVGEDTVRFALMFGVWSSLYKFVNNALRLLTPLPPGMTKTILKQRKAKAQARLLVADEPEGGLTMNSKHKKQDSNKKEWRHLSFYDPRVRYWHPYVSGAISSLALLVEKKSLAQSFGPQLFVRGLQGTYTMASTMGLVHIPHAAVLVFGIANAQIMFSWLSMPRFLPRAYKLWIDKASDLNPRVLESYQNAMHNGAPDPWALVDVLGGQLPEPSSTNPLQYPSRPGNKFSPRGISGTTFAKVRQWMDEGTVNHFPTCHLSHPHNNNHLLVTIQNFFISWKWIMPVYLTLYFVPTLFLRPKYLLKDPKTGFSRIFMGATRSSAFLATYIGIVKSTFCLLHELSDYFHYGPFKHTKWAQALDVFFAQDRLKMLPGFLSSLSLFVEDQRRRSELTAYVVPKALESFWAMGRVNGYFPSVPGGDYLLSAVSISLIMGTYSHHPESLSRLVSLVIYQFLGRN
ncbi:hypothetical protein MVES1_001739 [Malassezia vespertilionis]|uniref:uncharacterized protein n=1 Tax=Malassezia vespertilionis TaxID=2020962 RepID=UPI0024B20036|nr:uncharacterized protein MVES1_001739 [Malassezia vespertilionis]WFD06394.1 hypothetical protein MVES1_001739 [Malassezia vespertilionis]